MNKYYIIIKLINILNGIKFYYMALLNKKFILIILGSLYSFQSYSQNIKSFFKAPDGKYLISTDLHIHTVFSDGSVWPDIRVD